GMLVLAAVWWAWGAYAWLTNTVNPDEGAVRIAMFAAMAAMFVAAISLPHAFGDDALRFALAYLAARILHVVLYHVATKDDPAMHGAVMRLAPGILVAPALLVVAAGFDGVTQGLIWVAALVIDFGSPIVSGMGGWKVSPAHFVERHSLFVIIAL